MKIKPNEKGLYEFDIEVVGTKKRKTLKGLIDTGSTICACTYEVITTLWARPVPVEIVNDENGNPHYLKTKKNGRLTDNLLYLDEF